MNILVTGGAGFIGSNLVRALTQYGKVKIIDDFSTGKVTNLNNLLTKDSIELFEISITDLNAIKPVFKNIDFVFHHAAIPNVDRSVKNPSKTNEVNITGTLNVLMASKENRIKKVIYASSSSVYGDTPELPKKEIMKPNPQSPYAISKLTGEYYCRVFSRIYGLKTISLRYFNVYGPYQDLYSEYSAVIPKFVNLLMDDKPPVIYGDGEQTRDFTYIKDVIDANILAMTQDVEGVYNISGGKRISINNLYHIICSIISKDVTPIHLEPRKGDIRDSLADISMAKKELGYEPKYDLEKGLRETIKWYQKSLKK